MVCLDPWDLMMEIVMIPFFRRGNLEKRLEHIWKDYKRY